MFNLDGNLKFVNVDMDYLKHLHNACSEVFYKPNDYDNKPYLGVLMTNNDKKYVLPLTSAKEKHKTWKDAYPDRFLFLLSKIKILYLKMLYVLQQMMIQKLSISYLL